MVKRQTATATAHPVSPGDAGPNPQDFKLMAVYGNVALATDRTVFKIADDSGKIVVRNQATVLRTFVKLNGKWVPAAAALVPVKEPAPVPANHFVVVLTRQGHFKCGWPLPGGARQGNHGQRHDDEVWAPDIRSRRFPQNGLIA